MKSQLVEDVRTLLETVRAVADLDEAELQAIGRLELYAEKRRGAMFRASDGDTSKEAARVAKATAPTMAERVLAVFTELGGGWTDSQLIEQVGGVPGSVIRRRGDLVTAGFVVDSGERRPSRNGCASTVWAAAPGPPR